MRDVCSNWLHVSLSCDARRKKNKTADVQVAAEYRVRQKCRFNLKRYNVFNFWSKMTLKATALLYF